MTNISFGTTLELLDCISKKFDTNFFSCNQFQSVKWKYFLQNLTDTEYGHATEELLLQMVRCSNAQVCNICYCFICISKLLEQYCTHLHDKICDN